jgi:hypothetical protein
MILAQPIATVPKLNFLSPISEVFTFPVSATFIGGTTEAINLTLTAGNISVSNIVVENFGEGSITLSGKGALSVDNVLTETVRWLMPASLDENMTNATMSFHTDFAMQYPEKDSSLGFPNNAIFPLHRTGHSYLAPNGTKLWTEWKGSEKVTFVESGALPSELFIDNISLSYPSLQGKGNVLNMTDIMGEYPALIEVGTEEATSSVRNNDWVITLTFAILLFAVLDLGSYENRNDAQTDVAKKGDHNDEAKKSPEQAETTNIGENPKHKHKHKHQSNYRCILDTIQPISKGLN